MIQGCIVNFSTHKTQNSFVIKKEFSTFFRANRASKIGISVVTFRRDMFYNLNRVSKEINTSGLNQFINNLGSTFKVFYLCLISPFCAGIDIIRKGNFSHV